MFDSSRPPLTSFFLFLRPGARKTQKKKNTTKKHSTSLFKKRVRSFNQRTKQAKSALPYQGSAPCPRFFVGVCVAAAPPVMCEARARRRRIAAATPSASCCKRAVYAAARAKIAAVLRGAGSLVSVATLREFSRSADAGACSNAGCKSFAVSRGPRAEAARFFVQAPHTRRGEFLYG